MGRQELTPPGLESLQPSHPENRWEEYTPIVDGHVHPYHVATIDLGESNKQAENDPQHLEMAFQRRNKLIAQALEVTQTLFMARGGTRDLVDIKNTREPLNGETDMLNAHDCIRITIFGRFGTPQR